MHGPVELPGLGIERIKLGGERGWCSLQNKEMEDVCKRVYEAPKVDEDVVVCTLSCGTPQNMVYNPTRWP